MKNKTNERSDRDTLISKKDLEITENLEKRIFTSRTCKSKVSVYPEAIEIGKVSTLIDFDIVEICPEMGKNYLLRTENFPDFI